jgi:CheY-like chemotaxis protein
MGQNTRLEAHPDIAVVFSDLVMPGGLSGLDIARHVRAHHPAAHVILTSGYSAELMDEDEVAALKVQILRKPYRQAELARALGEALSDPPPVED